MRVVSVNVGMPRQVEWYGRTVLTGIFKSPVAAKLTVRCRSIDGDGKADLAVHGGVEKAVDAYPSKRYGSWREGLGHELTPGIFGENLTTAGLLEGRKQGRDQGENVFRFVGRCCHAKNSECSTEGFV
jgi:MOSC domain-containing protein YiiM